MKKKIYQLVTLTILLLCACEASAGQVRAYVSGFAVTGVEKREELKPALQTLLASRLSGEAVVVVDSPVTADITVTGSYLVFGRIFSIDAVAKNPAGSVVARAFVQGDSQDELIPAMGKLAKALTDEIVKVPANLFAVRPAPVAATGEKASADIVRKEPAPAATPSEIVRPEEFRKAAGAAWVSQRLTGPLSGIAQGRTLPNGDVELFLVGKRSLGYYLKGKDLRLQAEVTLPVGDKILGVDTADLDGDGVPEVYVTVMSGGYLASQVWVPGSGSLKKTADKVPYFFRGMSLGGKQKKIYAQEMNVDGEFYGDIYELASATGGYTVKNPLKLPPNGTLYNFNRFTDPQGKELTVLLNQGGYLIVFSPEREELWRSSDKFGGSELYYQRPDQAGKNQGTYSPLAFLEQRIVVTRGGEIIVPQNTGFWAIGNNRAYGKNSLFAFGWNGSTLDEKWHTKQSQNYLADFSFNEDAKELLLLEVVQKEGLIDKGASMVSVKKVE